MQSPADGFHIGNMKKTFLLQTIVALSLFTWDLQASTRGVLILAHGTGHDHHGFLATGGTWEETILRTIKEVEGRTRMPMEVAFGMWSKGNFQKGVERLAARGATDLRVVPLFVSSHSDVIRAQRYQFHLTDKNPLPFDPGRVRIPPTISNVTMSGALDAAAELSAILEARARELVAAPETGELILVAHGPVSDEDDALWLADLRAHADRIAIDLPKHVLTVRDDAEPPVRDEMTRRLRALVAGIHERGRGPLILPVLLAPGGIEGGLRERLKGLEYGYVGHMIAPDPLLGDWILRKSQEETPPERATEWAQHRCGHPGK